MDADRTNAVLASIDGALADAEMPDAMRWHPDPGAVKGAPPPFDGQTVWLPPQRYEQAARPAPARTWLGPDCVAFDHESCEAPLICLCTCHDRQQPTHPAGYQPVDPPPQRHERAPRVYHCPPGPDLIILDEPLGPPPPPTVRGGIRYPPPPAVREALLDRLAQAFDVPRDLIAPPSQIAVRAAAEARREAMVEALRDASEQLGAAIRSVGESLAPAWARFGADLRAAGIPLTPGPPPREPHDPAEVRAAALAARQSGAGSGPRRPGPEQARRPRRHP